MKYFILILAFLLPISLFSWPGRRFTNSAKVEKRIREGYVCTVCFTIGSNPKQCFNNNVVFVKSGKNKLIIWFTNGTKKQINGDITSVEDDCDGR